MSCLFCQFATHVIPCHTVWESDTHLAFLTIFPNTDGVTVVIPKHHLPSYIFENTDEEIAALMSASKIVAKKIDTAFDDVGRTGVIFEGFGVDHLHAKLYPMHGTGHLQQWQNIESNKPTEFFTTYPGYLSSHDCHEAETATLAAIAERIRNS